MTSRGFGILPRNGGVRKRRPRKRLYIASVPQDVEPVSQNSLPPLSSSETHQHLNKALGVQILPINAHKNPHRYCELKVGAKVRVRPPSKKSALIPSITPSDSARAPTPSTATLRTRVIPRTKKQALRSFSPLSLTVLPILFHLSKLFPNPKWVLTVRSPLRAFEPKKSVVAAAAVRGNSDLRVDRDRDMLGSGLNLVTTVIGFGMSATFIVFICARLICGRIRSADSRAAAFDIEMRSDLDAPEHTISGLEAVVVATIPTMKYNREAFHSAEDAQCSICLGDYQEKEILRIMPTCHHNFHLACIDVWLQKHSTCPICRLPLNDSFDVAPMFELLQPMDSPEAPSDNSNQWLLPNRQRSEGGENNREIHESVSLNLGVPAGGAETGT